MKFLFYLGHPAHFHLFKHTMKRLRTNGHTIEIIIKTKDILEKLLESDNIGYTNILSEGRKNTKFSMLMAVLKRDWRLSKFLQKNRVDVMVGSEPSLAQVGKLFGIPSLIVVEDDTHVIPYFASITYPFTRTIISPKSCDIGKWSHKKISYRGCQKLAYLHPNVFRPDPGIIESINCDGKKVFLLRLSKLSAHHDFGIKGIDKELLLRLVEILSRNGRVFISAEQQLAPEFRKYHLDIDVSAMHHFLYYPSIRFSDFAGRIGVLEELEHKYGLTYGIKTSEPEKLYAKIEELLRTPNLKQEWQKRRQKMLSEKIDVTAFMVWFIENYPESGKVMRENPDYQFRFMNNRLPKQENRTDFPGRQSDDRYVAKMV